VINSPSVLDRLIAHRQQFPALAGKQYFNYGGQGPMAQIALDAMVQAHQQMQQLGPFSGAANQWVMTEVAQTRAAIAAALGTTADTITLTEDVTVGCNIPLWGIAWRTGDHILLSDCEHPGIIATVQEICRRFGVTYSVCPLLETVNGGDPAAVVAQHLQPNTRLLVISHIFWNTGQVLPLESIVDCCHSHANPVWVLVDAAQSAEELGKVAQGDLVGPVGEGFRRVFVGFQKDTIATRSHSGSRENGCQLAIAPGGLPYPAGALH